jgi:hypothetical protein
VHCAFASVLERQTRSFPQYPMRLSMVRQYWSPVSPVAEQVYLQKPPMHFFGVSAVPPHWVSSVQFGCGRVSISHAPWLQKFPAPHSVSAVHDFTHVPAAQ